jgi:hypothetical protein
MGIDLHKSYSYVVVLDDRGMLATSVIHAINGSLYANSDLASWRSLFNFRA